MRNRLYQSARRRLEP